MKAFPLVALLLIASPTVLSAQGAVAPAAEETQELLPNQKAFLNLPEEQRKEFIKHLGEANRVFQQKRIFEALAELEKAEKIFKDSPEIYNLRGSCYVEMRAFDKAMDCFKEALALTSDNPSVKFNIGEVYFVTKKWAEALGIFEQVIKELPEENKALGRLVEFKILLCKNQLGEKEEVLKLAAKYDDMDDSPYYYYAQAAIAYDEDKLVEAEQWLGRARRVFRNPATIAPWQDTMVEYGYIKSFYGNDPSTVDE